MMILISILNGVFISVLSIYVLRIWLINGGDYGIPLGAVAGYFVLRSKSNKKIEPEATGEKDILLHNEEQNDKDIKESSSPESEDVKAQKILPNKSEDIQAYEAAEDKSAFDKENYKNKGNQEAADEKVNQRVDFSYLNEEKSLAEDIISELDSDRN